VEDILDMFKNLILKGSTLWLGEYAECIKLNEYKYCVISKPMPPFGMAPNTVMTLFISKLIFVNYIYILIK
jgi:hypothetical protein